MPNCGPPASGGRFAAPGGVRSGPPDRGWFPRACLTGLLALVLAGCVSDPVASSERLAAAGGAEKSVMPGSGFRHVVFSRNLRPEFRPAPARIHVYIGGDGRAFLNRHRVSPDPTPANPLALRLMLADPAPAVYVGRPCYHGVADAGCNPDLWTLGRYSEGVIDSMVAVIGEFGARHPTTELVLFGYSGGGVIALLSAARLGQVGQVVTIAAPLDVAAWTDVHGYTPLVRSLDPARQSAWPPGLRQLHYHGGRDPNVPPELVRGFAHRLAALGADAEFQVVAEFDHACCWVDAWSRLLAPLAATPVAVSSAVASALPAHGVAHR